MWQNIVVIILIICLSYLFRQTSYKGNNKSNSFDAQMLFILLSLGGIVFYKIIYLKSVMKKDKEVIVIEKDEGFQTEFQQELTNFGNNNNPNEEPSIERVTIQQYNQLRDNIAIIEEQLNNNNQQLSGDTKNFMGVEKQQTIQSNDLDVLEKKIKEMMLNNNLKNQNDNDKNAKKIPVYNSCYNADGELSQEDEPITKEEVENIKKEYETIKDLIENVTTNFNVDLNI
jgi:hypothetical protein